MSKPASKKKKRAASAPDAAPSAATVTSEPTSARTVDAPPDAPARRRVVGAIALFTLVQLAIPLRYYLGSDLYDERFAWRMFSAVRVQTCEVTVTEERDGRSEALALYSFLPAPWVGLLQRSRPAVVRGFLAWRCEPEEGEAPTAVRVRSACLDATGDALPPVTRERDCESGRYTESVSEGAP